MPSKIPQTKFICGYCKKEFKYHAEYVAHIDNDHWEFNDKTDMMPNS